MPSAMVSLMSLADAERFKAARAAQSFIAEVFKIPASAVQIISVPWDCERRLFDVQVGWNYPGDEYIVFGTGSVIVVSKRYEALYDMSLHTDAWAASYVDTLPDCAIVESASDWK